MNINKYDIDIEKAIKKINKNNFKKVVIQIPEGLKLYTSNFVDIIEKETNAKVLVYADPCYGACDIVDNALDSDFAIQIGHLPIPSLKNTSIPTFFINAKSNIDISKIINKSIKRIKGKNIGLVTTAQHIHTLEKVKRILIENNLKPIIGKGDNRIESAGQILGCNFSSATSISKNVDSFLFIGSGNFHPLGLMLCTKKPVVVVDPYLNKIIDEELIETKDIILRQRYGAIARSKDAKVFGILIGRKKGQKRIDLAYEIKDKLQSNNKKSYIFALDYFSPVVIESFTDIDCFVSTACPRIAIDDYMQYKIPIITPVELDILLGKRKWEDYNFDEIKE